MRRAELQDDEHARVPFSLIAVLLLMGTLFAGVAYREMAKESASIQQGELEIEFVEEITESTQIVLEMQARAMAMRAIVDADDGENEPDNAEMARQFAEDFANLVALEYGEDDPMDLSGYQISVLSDSLLIDLVSNPAATQMSTWEYSGDQIESEKVTSEDHYSSASDDTLQDILASGSTDERLVWRESNTSAFYRLNGAVDLKIVSKNTGTQYIRTILISSEVEVPNLLVDSRSRRLVNSLTDPEDGLARIVRDILTTVAQHRALTGWGAWNSDPDRINDDHNVQNLFSPEEIELAVNLGLILLVAKEWRILDIEAIEDLEANLGGSIPHGSTSISSLVSHYATGGHVKPALVVAVWEGLVPAPGSQSASAAQVGMGAIMERIIETVIDYYVAVVIAEFNIIFRDLSEIAQGDGDENWLFSFWSYLTGSEGRAEGVEAFQNFIVTTVEWADEEQLVNGNELLRQPFVGDASLILLSEGLPDEDTTGKTISFNYPSSYRVGETWWEVHGECGGGVNPPAKWFEYRNIASLSNPAVDIQFETQDAFAVSKDSLWSDSATQFVQAVHPLPPLDAENGLEAKIAATLRGFASDVSQDINSGSGDFAPNTGGWRNLVDWDSTAHPELQLMQHVEEMITELIAFLRNKIEALRAHLVHPIHDDLVAIYERIITFFSESTYDQLSDWEAQLARIRGEARSDIIDNTSFTDSEVDSNCNGPDNSRRQSPSDSELRSDLESSGHDWSGWLDGSIQTKYHSLRTYDLDRLEHVEGLWVPDMGEEKHETAVGSQVDELILGSMGEGEVNLISLIENSAENMVSAMRATSEFSNLPQDLAIKHDVPFELWRGNYPEALAAGTVREVSFKLQAGTDLRLASAQVHTSEEWAGLRANYDGSGESLHIIIGAASGAHFANLNTHEVTETYETSIPVAVVGHKDIFIKTVNGYLETESSLDPLRRTLSIDIDLEVNIAVQTGWPMYQQDSAGEFDYFEGHEPFETDPEAGMASLKDEVKDAYKLIKDALDYILDFLQDPLGALTDLIAKILKKLLMALRQALIDFISEKFSQLVNSMWQLWADYTDIEFGFWGFEFKICFPLNQGGDVQHAAWCKTTVPDGTGENPGMGHPVMAMASISWSRGLFPKEVSYSQPEDDVYGWDEFTRFSIYVIPYQKEAGVGSVGDFEWDENIKRCRYKPGTVVDGKNVGGRFTQTSNCVTEASGSYTIVAQIERVRVGSRLNIVVDPLKVASDHWLVLDYVKHPKGNKDGMRLHLEAPFETDYEIARVSTADIAPVDAILGSIPLGPTGLTIGFEVGFEIRYRTEIGSGHAPLMLDAVDLNPALNPAGIATPWVKLYNPNVAGNPVNPGADADYFICIVGTIRGCKDISSMGAVPGEGYGTFEIPDWSLKEKDGQAQARLILYRDSQPVDDTGWFADPDPGDRHHHKQTSGGSGWMDSTTGPDGTPPPPIVGPRQDIIRLIEAGDFGGAALTLLFESIEITFDELRHELTLDLEGATLFIQRLVNRFLNELIEIIRRGVVEVTLFIEGFVSTVGGGPEVGLRLAFSIDGQAIATILQWLMSYIGHYLQNIGDDSAQPPAFPQRVVAGLWVSVDLFGGSKSSRVAVQFKANIPLFQSPENRLFEWRIHFGVYVFTKNDDGKGWTEDWWFHGTIVPIPATRG